MIINTGVIFQKTVKFFQNNRMAIISKKALNTRVCAYNWMLNNNVRTVGIVQSLITTHSPILLFPPQKHNNTTCFSELGGHKFQSPEQTLSSTMQTQAQKSCSPMDYEKKTTTVQAAWITLHQLWEAPKENTERQQCSSSKTPCAWYQRLS